MLAQQLLCYPVVSDNLYPQLCCMRLPLLVLVFVFVCFFSACLLSGAPGGAKAEFPTEAVDCRLFCFTGVAAGCLVFLSIFALFPFLYSLSFLVPRSGSALLHVKYCNKNK